MKKTYHFSFGHHSFAIAQLEERVTVNHDVTGSNPVGGVAFNKRKLCILIFTSACNTMKIVL